MEHFNQKANEWDTPEKILQSEKYAQAIFNQLHGKNVKTVLEVGCGTGLLGSNFINDQTSLLGVDTSSGMLAVFNQKFKDRSNAHSLLLDLGKDDLPENYKTFDLILSSMAFHHLENPEAMIIKLKKYLSPNGLMAVIDLDQEDGTFHPDPKNMGVHHFGFSEQTINDWAKKAEFKEARREIVNVVNKNSKSYPIFLATFFN